MTTTTSSAFALKGSMMTLTIMHLLDPNPTEVDKQLRKTISDTPDLFRNMPIVLDLQNIDDSTQRIDFIELSAVLRDHGLIPVGICNGTETVQQSALMSGLGSLAGIKKSATPSQKPVTPSPTPAVNEHALIIKQPVRSGQRIYAKNTDLIIQSSVSNGAEIIADGNIHVYGSLRGRAIAGAQGYEQARIFCQSLEAELVSIAGNYKLHDKLNIKDATGPIVVWLDEGQLSVDVL